MAIRDNSIDSMNTNQFQTSDIKTSEKLTVLDACNNEFILIKRVDNSITFEYKPMQPMNSCTGAYSGGTPVFKHLQSGEWTKIMDAFQRVKHRTKHSRGRVKGTLLFQYTSGETVDSRIIDLFTETGKELTSFFHAYNE